ncbi:MAG: tRNA (guanine-N7-)-methyltransferase [Patescibacteria group bacterium]|nr:tRNA (guanine-N7-)-methyltransferase [Patescibacteria group bacterium]
MIDPKEFVITRKRKKYKFAKFANSPLCFEYEQWSKSVADVIEVGAGTALFSVELAARNPDKTFVAIDDKADRLQKGAYAAEEKGLTNIRFLRARADQLTDCFQPGSIETIWLTFADPFPKRRSAGRRMTHPTFLKIYQSLLCQGG